MTKLTAATPLEGRDVTHGETRLTESLPGRLTWLAPWPGAEGALSEALQAAHGLRFPAPGQVLEAGEARCIWHGRAQALLVGPEPAARLADHGAVLDVTEVWAGLRLTGPAVPQVMARLTPVDMRPAQRVAGQTVRSLLAHMNAQVTAMPDGVEILVMRSMAGTAAHEIEEAMKSVAARMEVG